MKWLPIVFVFAGFSTSCAHTQDEDIGSSRYVYIVGVNVPVTPDGHTCRNACAKKLTQDTCTQTDPQDGHSVQVAPGPYSQAFGCPGRVTECMLECPGAAIDSNNPPRIARINRPFAQADAEAKQAARKRATSAANETNYGITGRIETVVTIDNAIDGDDDDLDDEDEDENGEED